MKIKYKILLLIILVSFVIFKLDLISDLSDLKNTASNLTPAPKFSGSIKIGIVIPLDQDYSIFQTSLEMGLKTATEYVNSQGGVINSNLTYEFIDYYKIKDLIKSNALGSYDIFLLFGRDSTISYSITDLSHLQKPMFYIQDGKCKTVSEIEGKSPSKLVFSLGLTWEQMNEHLILHTINKLENYTKQTGVVLFGNNTKEDLTYLENITNLYKNLGIEILDAKYVDSRIIDFYGEIQRILFLKSDFVFFNATISSGVEYIKQLAKQNISDISLISSISNLPEEVTFSLPKETQGYYTISHYNSSINTPENIAFIEAVKKDNPELLFISTTMESAYSFILFLRAAYQKAGSTELSKVLTAMEEVKLTLPRGAVEMNKANHVLSQPFYVSKVKDGKHEVEDKVEFSIHPQISNCEIFYEEKPQNPYD